MKHPVYTNGIFEELRRMKIGCRIGRNYVGVLGYADDLYLMSPSLDGLQDMLKVCEKYAENHNLKFSTDENPNKSKTKCMAYLYKERELPNMLLCGNKLPWVNNGKHLGMRIDAKKDNLLTKDTGVSHKISTVFETLPFIEKLSFFDNFFTEVTGKSYIFGGYDGLK